MDSHSEHTELYKKVLLGQDWHSLKNKKVLASGQFESGQFGRCERCKCFELAKNLELHHKHYNTLGQETIDDVELLCPACHKLADETRIERTTFERGLETYAIKKYGEDWYDRFDIDEIEEEFNEWRDKQDEK